MARSSVLSVEPDAALRVASSDSVRLSLDVDDEIASARLVPTMGEPADLKVLDNAAYLPRMKAPDVATVEWVGESTYCTYLTVVSRHYFGIDALRGFGDGQDQFDLLPESALWAARQAATEVFERNAGRSFVRQLGRTKDYGRSSMLTLHDGDVQELLTEGYALVSDCQVVPCGCGPYPRWVEYVYGLDSMPAQVSRATLELAAYMLRPTNRPVGATGESTDAGYIHFTTAGQDGATDIPEVNAAIEQFGRGGQLVW